MASAIMHLCVAKKVNEELGMDEKQLFLGAIAPDLSKLVGERKNASHFLDEQREDSIPNIERFLKNYQRELDKPYEMGYLIHLLTDKYWFLDYVYKFIEAYEEKEEIDAELSYTAVKNLIYKDYTNLNIDLIDKYELDLYMFANEIKYPKSIVKEIDTNKLHILIEKTGSIILESQKGEHSFIVDISDVTTFIDECANKIIEDLKLILEK